MHYSLKFFCWLAPTCLMAQSAVLKEIMFQVTSDVGFGNEVCVLGDHPLLGGGDPLRAPKLTWSDGNVWRGRISLPAGGSFVHTYIRRSYAPTSWGNSTNQAAIGTAATVAAPTHAAPPWGAKTVIYRSGFARAFILYRDRTLSGAWTQAELRRIGPGRTPGESTYRIDGIAPSGSTLEFVFHNGSGVWDNAPAPPSGAAQGAAPAVPAPYQGLSGPYNYRTPLDVFAVQDGQVFNYLPATTPSAPRFETRVVNSTVAGIPGRPVQILLPRGYDEHTSKRYPVVYFHDGQNVFFPGGPFGTWDADRISRYETAQGRMRETLIVSIPNGNDYGSNRISEYMPDGDSISYAGTSYQGKAADYARFLIDNVKPTLDAHYRTLGNQANTFTAGSSMGGLVSDFIGFTHSDRFGGVGVFSPAYWAAENWVNLRDAGLKLPLRRYLYMGTAESSTGESSSNVYWRGALRAYDAYLRAGHSANGDLFFSGGAGAAHNEPAWSRRLPEFFSILLDPMRESSPLAQELFPPQLALAAMTPPDYRLRYMALMGSVQTLEYGNSLHLPEWQLELPPSRELWEERVISAPLGLPNSGRHFWRIKQEVWPGR